MTAAATITRDEALAGLSAIAGPADTRLDGDAIRVAPGSTTQIAEILRFANQHGLSVVATGNGTKLTWGDPVAPEIFLDLGRMNALSEHAWQDLTCTVEAGCTWAAMQSELARHGQMVALDPLWPDRATVGGIVSTNDSGTLRLRYGGLRDLIIGMTVVLADGTIAKSGGKVVKNVAGYDLHKLLTGSFGTLAVIAEVNFRLHPIEQHARSFTFTAPDASHFAQPLRDLLHVQLALSAAQLRLANDRCAIDVRICTRPECIDAQAAQLRTIFGDLTISEAADSVWQAREQLFASDNATVVKASMLPTEICDVATGFMRSAAAIDVSLVAQATGLATIAFSTRSVPGADAGAVPQAIDRLRARLRPTGGSVVVLEPGDVSGERPDVWDCQSDALLLMREIKRRFDPNRILSPGRFVGGI
jgi:glycolate oxidase FAD binding subunit